MKEKWYITVLRIVGAAIAAALGAFGGVASSM